MRKTDSARIAKVDIHMVMTLKALLETGQVSRAAQSLGVTQPTVSQTLRRMRSYFGDPLFVRSGNALRPTPRALELKASVDRVAREIDAMSQRPPSFDPGTATREFTVAMTDAGELLGLAHAMGHFTAEAPHCALRSIRSRADEAHRLLESGALDLAFGSYSAINENLRQSKLGDYDLVCCTAPGQFSDWTAEHYLAARHVVVPRFGEEDDQVAPVLRRLGLARRVVLSLPNHVAALAAVSQSGLVATVPRHVASALARSYPVQLREPPLPLGRISTYMVWHERFHQDPSHLWLRQTLARFYPRPGQLPQEPLAGAGSLAP